MPGHHLLGPSAADRVLICTPSARLGDSYPKTSSVYADEGNRAHDVAEDRLCAFFGYPVPNNQEPDNQGVSDHVDEYVTFCVNLAAQYKSRGPVSVYVEREFSLAEYIPEGFGTSDFGVFAAAEGV